MSETQSVCKHCQKEIVVRWGKWHTLAPESSAYCKKVDNFHEPVSEPASTGEPGTGFYRSASLQESIAQDEVERAARPSEPSARTCDWPFSGTGICGQSEACMKANRCLKNLPSAPQTSADPQPLPCRTPGAVYHFKLAHLEQSGREILTLHVYMPQEISIAEEQAQSIEEKLHDACEVILSAYWPDTFAAAPQPVSGEPWGKIFSEEIRESKDPVVRLADSIVYGCAIVTPRTDDNLGLFSDETYVKEVRSVVEKLRRYFPPASQTPESK